MSTESLESVSFPLFELLDEDVWHDWLSRHRKAILDQQLVDDHGSTPLHWATVFRQKERVVDLLELGCSVWVQDREGMTVMELMFFDKPEPLPWGAWMKRFPGSFSPLHDSFDPLAFSRLMIVLAQRQQWESIEALCRVVPLDLCPYAHWEAPLGSQMDKTFRQMGPMPWAHAALLIQEPRWLKLLAAWGISLTQTWNGYRLDRVSRMIHGKQADLVFSELWKIYWSHWKRALQDKGFGVWSR